MIHGAALISMLILHGLVAVALLGAVTHQSVALLSSPRRAADGFAARYISVSSRNFPAAVATAYAINAILGALLYPAYRLDVRIPLEDMQLGWAIGLFELKEHFGGIGLALLPLYLWSWHGSDARGRTGISLVLAFIVWFDFLAGHVINNIRGL